MKWEESSWYVNSVKPDVSTETLDGLIREHDQIRIVRRSVLGFPTDTFALVFENRATPKIWQDCKLELRDASGHEVDYSDLIDTRVPFDFLPLPPWIETHAGYRKEYFKVADRMRDLCVPNSGYIRLEGELRIGANRERVILCKTCDRRILHSTGGLLVLSVKVQQGSSGTLLQGGLAHADPDLRGR